MKNLEREDFLIHYLLQHPGFITVATVANEMVVSAKTIYRLIKQLNQKNNALLIESEKGKGIQLNYSAYLESHYNHYQDKETKPIHYNFSPVERRLHILKELLFHAPLSLRESELFSRYYLSPSAIYADEELIEASLKQYGLSLHKDGTRLFVNGPEIKIRQALIQLLTKLNLLNIDDMNHLDSNLNQNALQFVVRQLELIEQKIDSIIPAPYNVNLLTHLYILICRAGKGDFDFPNLLDDMDSIQQDVYYPIAQKVKNNIEGYLCKQLPESETANICSYLAGSRIESEKAVENSHLASTEVQQITAFYIHEFARRSHTLVQHELIDTDLASHITPMLHRLRRGLPINNPLLDDIRQEYGQVYNIIQDISDELSIKFHLPAINDDEVGFITLYFARYMEQHPHQLRALIICTTGLGTSELLRTKVQRFFPELDIVGTASTRTITPAYLAEKSVDIILTTVKLNVQWPVPAILVNTLFIERDKQNVQQALTSIQQVNTSISSTSVIPIMTIPTAVTSKQALFKTMLLQAPTEIQQHRIAILTALTEREKLGDTCIATSVALAHAQVAAISQPYLAVSILDKPFNWDHDSHTIHILLMILLPTIPDSYTIKTLHQLMHKLADDDIIDQLQQNRQPEIIRQLLFS